MIEFRNIDNQIEMRGEVEELRGVIPLIETAWGADDQLIKDITEACDAGSSTVSVDIPKSSVADFAELLVHDGDTNQQAAGRQLQGFFGG